MMCHYAYGNIRSTTGSMPTDFGFTGQRRDASAGLMYYGARYYDSALARFITADTIVPSAGNPQSLNRYSYVLNNPVKYVDPSGHCPICIFAVGFYLGARVGFEAGLELSPNGGRLARDSIGGQLVTNLSEVIAQESARQQVNPILVAAVIRHESAGSRRFFTPLPLTQPGLLANLEESLQASIEDNLLPDRPASIGPGQMQLRRAKELEALGYVKPRGSDFERMQALLGNETAVEYLAGMLKYSSDRLRQIPGFNDLSTKDQSRLILIGYNVEWSGPKGLLANIQKYGFLRTIERFGYDNETIDEYLRWAFHEEVQQ